MVGGAHPTNVLNQWEMLILETRVNVGKWVRIE